MHVKLNKRVAQELNAPGAFQGHIANAENIGKSSNALADMCDAEHPDDPVER